MKPEEKDLLAGALRKEAKLIGPEPATSVVRPEAAAEPAAEPNTAKAPIAPSVEKPAAPPPPEVGNIKWKDLSGRPSGKPIEWKDIPLPDGARPIGEASPGIRVELPPSSVRPAVEAGASGVRWELGPEASPEAEELRATRFESLGDQAKKAIKWFFKKAGVAAKWTYEHTPGAKQVVSAVERRVNRSGVEMAHTNAIDRVKVMFSDQMANWHISKAVKLNSQLEAQNKLVAELEAKVKNPKGSFLSYDWNQLRLRLAQKKAEDLQSKLEYRNDRRATYENERDTICKGYNDRIEEKCAPYIEKIRDAETERDQIKEEIGVFIKDKEQLESQLKEQEAGKAKVSIFDRAEFNKNIKDIKSKIKECNSVIRDKQKAQNKRDVVIAKANQDIDPWKDKVRDMTRVMERRKGIITKAPQRKATTSVMAEHRPVRGAGSKADSMTTSAEAGSRTTETTGTFSNASLVAEWNKRFGANFKLDVKDLQGTDSSKKEFAEKIRKKINEAEKKGAKIPNKKQLEKDLGVFERNVNIK